MSDVDVAILAFTVLVNESKAMTATATTKPLSILSY
jgi:hypothetical protein